ncbi:serine hydrolase domain-containing protein [Actinoplanes nipponensis]|uniref:serine hydrolase domain-containing protein n=1 Tax=Actinoplanes nipponensis TaxID=135950 RepID=UPI0031F09228
MVALAVLLLVDRGLIALDDPIARHWPGFRTEASVRQLLTHTAGLPFFPVPRDAAAWSDWDLLCADLAAAAPEWPPGTVAAEHALTYGHLTGELVRRVDGRSPERFVAEEIARPWRLDLGFGTTEPHRCADLEFDGPDRAAELLGAPGSVHARAVSNPHGARDLAVLNSDLWRRAVIPAVNLHATADALAPLLFGLLAGGVLDGRRPAQRGARDRPRVRALLRPGPVPRPGQPPGDSACSWNRTGPGGMGGLGGNAAWARPGDRPHHRVRHPPDRRLRPGRGHRRGYFLGTTSHLTPGPADSVPSRNGKHHGKGGGS